MLHYLSNELYILKFETIIFFQIKFNQRIKMSSFDNSSTNASQEPTGVVDELVITALYSIISYACTYFTI